MQLLLVTNLYPPQELGGYGRSMADFAWGLMQRGHHVQVLCADVPHLGDSSDGPSGEPVSRCLTLKGSFEGGVQLDQNPERCRASDAANQNWVGRWLKQRDWDGVLVGNIDLLGLETLQPIIDAAIPLLHHIGFVTPPFDPKLTPKTTRYQVVCASQTVKQNLMQAGMANQHRTSGVSRRTGGVVRKPNRWPRPTSAAIPFAATTPQDLLRRPSNEQQRPPYLAGSHCTLKQQKYSDLLHARRRSISGELYASHAKVH